MTVRSGLPFSAQRDALFNELHTRPFPTLAHPAHLSHLAIEAPADAEAERAHLSRLCTRYAVPAPLPDANCYYQDFGAFTLRWERHTEFSTYLVIVQDTGGEPFAQPALDVLPAEWLREIPGAVFSALHVEIAEADTHPTDKDALRRYFEGQRLLGSKVVGEGAEVWTAYRIHADGFGRFLVLNRRLNPCQLGRLVRALLELETYRMSMLQALPLAKSIAPQMWSMDEELARIIQQITDIESLEDEQRLVRELSVLAARTERLISDTNYRFSAASAYHALVQARLDELRETEIPGLMTLREFLGRRLVPAWRTCESTRDYLDDLSTRINRANALLRARVDLSLEQQNQALLASMNRRSRLQLRLQQAVEGLSVVAISYYTVGLIKYAGEAAKAGGLPVSSGAVAGASVPLVLAGVAWMLHRFRKQVHEDDQQSA
ncbi:DUF3422 domain-containing protein [Hahella sp. SMD15-11]|uniref:DUF3422 domain-containing protein n=1 Tax=Thermohahella caldifontis TaxID=3142973 RepID=A0AB39UYE5_9GAMM